MAVDDIVSLGGQRGRRWPRLTVAAAGAGLVAAGVLGHLPASNHVHTGPAAVRRGPDHNTSVRGGPVQLAGLGGGAARLLNHSPGSNKLSPTIGG
jgi:hypothetical protein